METKSGPVTLEQLHQRPRRRNRPYAMSKQETAAALTPLSLWLGPTMEIALFIIRCVSAATNIRRF